MKANFIDLSDLVIHLFSSLFPILKVGQFLFNPPATLGAVGFKGKHPNFFLAKLAKPSKPIFFPKVEKSDAN